MGAFFHGYFIAEDVLYKSEMRFGCMGLSDLALA